MYAYKNEEYVVIDLTRDMLDRINYGTLEGFKNGLGFVRKYERRTKIFKPAKVCVMMNEMPDMSKLSQDRYKIFEL